MKAPFPPKAAPKPGMKKPFSPVEQMAKAKALREMAPRAQPEEEVEADTGKGSGPRRMPPNGFGR